MNKIAILTDSCAEISGDMQQGLPIFVLPLTVRAGGKEYRDGVDITGPEIHRILRYDLPKTSLPGGDVVEDTLDEIARQGYTHVLAVMLSGGISGTVNRMRLRAQEETRMTIKVFDSSLASIGEGSVVLQLARYVQEGVSWEELLFRASELIHNTTVFVSVDTLEYLKKGRRIGRVTAMAGTALQIKPILSFGEGGELGSVAKVRGRHAVVEKLTQLVRQELGPGTGKRYNLLMAWDGVTEGADELRRALVRALPRFENFYEVHFGAVLTTYLGPGGMGAGIQVLDTIPRGGDSDRVRALLQKQRENARALLHWAGIG